MTQVEKINKFIDEIAGRISRRMTFDPKNIKQRLESVKKFTVTMTGNDVTGVTTGTLKRTYHPGYTFRDIETLEAAPVREIVDEMLAKIETQAKLLDAAAKSVEASNIYLAQQSALISRMGIQAMDDAEVIAEMKIREEKLVGALEFYADKHNWSMGTHNSCSSMIGGGDHDGVSNTKYYVAGSIARTTLEELKAGKA